MIDIIDSDTEKKMKTNNTALGFLLAITFIVCASSAYATNYGLEITIYDGIGDTYGVNATHEDNEAEPGMVQSQAWDLEGFFLDGTALTIVGGYNFYTGYGGMNAGDIFIDLDGDALYSPGTNSNITTNGSQTLSNADYLYDYVLNISWQSSTFDIVKLTDNSVLMSTYYGAQYNNASNPWTYHSGGEVIASSISFADYGKSSQDNTGFDSWVGKAGAGNHYVATFDISGIDLSGGALFHNTMECGNDNLMGQVAPAPVPEPATMLLLGTGLIGLAGVTRRKLKK